MITTSRVELAAGRWIVDPAHSMAAFRVGNFGRTVPRIVIGHAVDITVTAAIRLTTS